MVLLPTSRMMGCQFRGNGERQTFEGEDLHLATSELAAVGTSQVRTAEDAGLSAAINLTKKTAFYQHPRQIPGFDGSIGTIRFVYQ